MRSKTIIAAVVAGFLAGVAVAKQPGPVIQNLGLLVPTPMPSPKHEEHIRLITSFTLGNKPTGESVISFESTDFGVSGKGEDTRYRTVATEQYSLADVKPELRDLRDQITAKVRDLESDLLKYVEVSGPPRVREPLGGSGPRP
jgi:hypothetical protein